MDYRTWTQALADCCWAAVVVAAAVGLLLAAALVPAPPAALPLVPLVGLGLPTVVAYELPPTIASVAPTAGSRPQYAAIWHSFPKRFTRSTSDPAQQDHAASRRPSPGDLTWCSASRARAGRAQRRGALPSAENATRL
jgi:hypothetical protein